MHVRFLVSGTPRDSSLLKAVAKSASKASTSWLKVNTRSRNRKSVAKAASVGSSMRCSPPIPVVAGSTQKGGSKVSRHAYDV